MPALRRKPVDASGQQLEADMLSADRVSRPWPGTACRARTPDYFSRTDGPSCTPPMPASAGECLQALTFAESWMGSLRRANSKVSG